MVHHDGGLIEFCKMAFFQSSFCYQNVVFSISFVIRTHTDSALKRSKSEASSGKQENGRHCLLMST